MTKIRLGVKQLENDPFDFFKDKKNINNNRDWSSFKKIMNKSNASRKACLLLPLKTYPVGQLGGPTKRRKD